MMEATKVQTYLIWSNAHGKWWRGMYGYTEHLSEAGRFARDHALSICLNGIMGDAQRLGMLPDLPVPLADVQALQQQYHARYPHVSIERWEQPPQPAATWPDDDPMFAEVSP